jgi:predicted hydrolase (HD superfamily)
VNRDELRAGASELGVDFDEHLQIVIDALTERRDELLGGESAGSGDAAASA